MLDQNQEKYVRYVVVLRHKNLLIAFEEESREGFIDSFDGDDDFAEHLEYVYNESTCPTNFIFRSKPGVIIDLEEMDADPHGIFHFVTWDKRLTLEDGTPLNLEGESESILLDHFKDIIKSELAKGLV